MIDTLLRFLAPHYCYSCGTIGSPLCINCENDISSDYESSCVVCAQPSANGSCLAHCLLIEKGWCLGVREGVLRDLTNDLKFAGSREIGTCLARCVTQVLPVLPTQVVLVPIPTIAAHVRQYGLDHTKLLVRQLAVQTSRPVEIALARKTRHVQHGKSRRVRQAQAAEAFMCAKTITDDKIYLLVDDVVTTGATLLAAATVLREAGAAHVWATVVVHQPKL